MENGRVLQVRNLSKAFPGVKALEKVRFDLDKGQVHAVMGENGAGKSTLMKVLAGLHQPDEGEILFKGRLVRIGNPHDAIRLGISMIHQELLPFPEMTVAENILMGREPASRFLGWIDRKAMRLEAASLLDQLRVRFSPTARMKDLSLSEMQVVEIARALSNNAEVIIMDEPTSALSGAEVEALFGVIRDLKARGVAVVYISHRMDEVFRIADTVTALRDGRYVATHPIGSLDRQRLIALMVGRDLAAPPGRYSCTRGEVLLAAQGLSRSGKFTDIHFELRGGEILGFAGLMGAGRTELMDAVYGLAQADKGDLLIHGKPVRIRNPRDALAHGIAMVTEDRRQYGLVMPMCIQHNLTLSNLADYSRSGLLDHGLERQAADAQIRAFSIQPPDGRRPVLNLSGGNQQKVVIAKAVLTNPDVLILDEPTRGIDIGAKAEVHEIIRRFAREGKGVIVVSSELPEILSLSHRVLVMREGVISAELDPAKTSQEEIMRHAAPGATERQEHA